MSAITPSTNLKLLMCPLELSDSNQLDFATEQAQYNYFNSLPRLEVENFTYQRKDYTIRYPACIDDILEYNYVMYQNEAYSNKWFYAYITDMTWINDHLTQITIKTDVYQTFQFDIEFKQSFVEREHVNDDTMGKHTIPEGLESGEYISCNLQPTTSGNLETCFCIAVSDLLISRYSTLNEIIPSGLYYMGVTSLDDVRTLTKYYDEEGKSDAINSIFVIPKEFFSSFSDIAIPLESGNVNVNISTTVRFSINPITINVTKVNYLGNNYTPKNNKLLCYPYSYLQVSNHNGSVINYLWEEFNRLQGGNTYTFSLRGVLTPGGSFSAYPIDYKNIYNNFDESITLAKYPIGGWNSDVYTNWLTQNGVNIAGIQLNATEAGYVGSAIGIGVGAAMLASGNIFGASMLGQGISEVYNTMQTNYQHSLIPDQARGNVNVGDYSFGYGLTNLEFKRISIKNEYAKIIDDYFSMYGYKVNEVKVPNITGRLNWNFVKCIGANIHGYFPEVYVNDLKNMFNAGVTIWHNPNTFLDYSQNNSIV